MFVLPVYVLCSAVSIVMSAKEHKFQFQFSTNTHRELARFMFGSYLALVVVWIILVPQFGIMGLLWGWFAVELAQVLFIMRLNHRFFAHHEVLKCALSGANGAAFARVPCRNDGCASAYKASAVVGARDHGSGSRSPHPRIGLPALQSGARHWVGAGSADEQVCARLKTSRTASSAGFERGVRRGDTRRDTRRSTLTPLRSIFLLRL